LASILLSCYNLVYFRSNVKKNSDFVFNFLENQADTPGNAQKQNTNKLIEMAAEQLASLLLKHSMLKKNSKYRQK